MIFAGPYFRARALDLDCHLDAENGTSIRHNITLLPHKVEDVHNAVVYSEGDGHVEHHPAEPRHGALVEGARPLRPPALQEAVPRGPVLGGLEALHAGFDHVDWGVAED